LSGDDERWRLIQHLIESPDLETRDRVAGLLVLLYSQPTTRLVRVQLSDIGIHDEGSVTLRLGELPLTLPAPVGRLVVELVEQRRGYAAVTAASNQWLFPGGRSGQHMSSQRMGHRLRQIGVPPRLARNTALIDLASELPAAVIAKLLGFSIKRAVTWNIEAGNTNPRYAAAVARGDTS
jgi:hypothetical protein